MFLTRVLQVLSVRTNVWVSVSGHVLDLLLKPPSRMCVTCQSESMWGDSRTMCGSVPVSKTSTLKHKEVPDLLELRADAVWTSWEQQHWCVHSRAYTCPASSCCSTGSAPRLDVHTCSCCCEGVGPTTCCFTGHGRGDVTGTSQWHPSDSPVFPSGCHSATPTLIWTSC